MILLAGFAGVAALLALIGVYGVVSYSVRQRPRELGLRMALGASGSRIVGQVVREGIIVVLVGVATGGAAALAAARFLSSLLFGVGAADPLTYGAMALLLTTAAGLACLVPAMRATKVDPLTVMRGNG
jgi:ABC-type antimicrobial peptide transport system permease subunit